MTRMTRYLSALVLSGALAGAQTAASAAAQVEMKEPAIYTVDPGVKIPLNLMNAVSTRSAAEGDRIYLETIFPILSGGRIVIPPGSYVAGTITQVRRAGKVKGRAEMYVRFDSLTLPNGVTRDFRGRLGALDGQNSETVERSEGKIKGDTNKGGDAAVVGQSAGWGTMAGAVAGRSGMGAGIGAAAGATAGLMGVLFSRGPDAILERGSTLEMVLDRELRFTSDELDFSGAMPSRRALTEGGQQGTGANKRPGLPGTRRWLN
jgi:type IV secretion system protein VirB10